MYVSVRRREVVPNGRKGILPAGLASHFFICDLPFVRGEVDTLRLC